METLLPGVFALVGVFIGAFLNAGVERSKWSRSARLDAGERLARTYELIWGDKSHSNLTIHLALLRMHLLGIGIARHKINALAQSANECWRDGHEHLGEGIYPTKGHAVDSELFNDLERRSMDIELSLFPERRRWLRRR